MTPLRLLGFGASIAGSVFLLGLVALFLFVLFLAAWGWAHTNGEGTGLPKEEPVPPPALSEPLTGENSVELISFGQDPERAKLNRTEVTNPASPEGTP